jgi:hypothetical protein
VRRLVLVPALVAGCALGMAPAPASPYAGESSRANSSTLIRGTDGNIWQVEVVVAKHELEGVKTDYELRVRLAGPCGEHGCTGPWYALEVAAKDVKFTGTTASVRTRFGGAPVVVSWKARRAPAAAGTPEPEAGEDDGTVTATIYRQDRSAPAQVTIAGLTCGTRSSHLTNQTGAILVVPGDDGGSPPAKLPKGFYRTSTRTPRCL